MSSATRRRFFRRLGHIPGDDPLGQALNDGGLAHPGLADQDRVVLGAAREHLHDPPNLFVPADDGVELAQPGQIGEVAAEFLQGLVFFFRVGVGDALGAADLLQDLEKCIPRDAGLGQNPAGLPALLVEEGEKDVLDADVLVLHLAGLGKSGLQQGFAAVREIGLPHAGSADPGEALDGAQRFRGDPLG